MSIHKEKLADAKGAPQRVLLPVHLAPDYRKEGFAVDEHADAILLDDLVERARAVDVLEVVRHARAALVPHADADQLRGGPAHQRLEALHRFWRLSRACAKEGTRRSAGECVWGERGGGTNEGERRFGCA